MTISADEGDAAFERLVGQLDYPMFVLTTVNEDELAGCLVGFASQVSIDPRRFLVGLSTKNRTYRVASGAERLAVHVISNEHRALARLFGEHSGDTTDKFAEVAWSAGPHGLPILDDAAAWFSGRILVRIPVGDHVAFLVEPEAGRCPTSIGDLITFGDVRDLDPGHGA